jgi:histidinol-phosphate phosphatase family protein
LTKVAKAHERADIEAAGGLERPRQAVILAGGRGTRLAPLTDSRPKPMIEFHGRPFLEYLIEFLRDQGFRRVLLLLGYLPEVIRDHFGDGSRFGVEIAYSVTDVGNDTGRRLYLARPQIEPCFLLAYCDNYCPVDIEAMWQRFQASGAPAMVTVYANEDGFTRDNLRVDDDGFVAIYDKSRAAPGLKGVDIGFILVRRELLDLLPNANISFEAVVYPELVKRHGLLAHVTRHRYYSVGNLGRLAETEAFLARRPTVILDRDGVLNRRMPKAQYVRDWSEWAWLPGVLEGLRRLKQAGWRVVVVTNQAGIARGAMTEAQLAAIHDRMRAEVAAAGGEIAAIYRCPHGWDDGCDCRKPKPGMLFQAQRDLRLDLSRTPFLGDDERDGQAAAAAGCPFVMIGEGHPLNEAIADLLSSESPAPPPC